MEPVTVLGLVAGALTTAAFVPQLLQVWRSRSTRDISLGMFVVLNLGVFLWLLYGILRVDWPVMVANFITLCLALAILALKLKHG